MAQDVATIEPVRRSSQDRLLEMIRTKHPDYHPVMAMVDVAMTTEDEQLEFRAHAEVAKYVVAVDKHSEIKVETVKTRRVVVELFGSPTPIQDNRDDNLVSAETRVLEDKPSAVLADLTTMAATRTTVTSRGPVEEIGGGMLSAWGGGDAADR